MSRMPSNRQRGAALAIALLILVVVTLLGVAAVRVTQVELKLAQNSESRVTAMQSADSIIALARTQLPVDDRLSYVACVSSLTPSICANTDTPLSLLGGSAQLQSHAYARVRREAPLFVEVNVLREAELSARAYDFARFTILGGYDRAADGLSAAEVTEGTLRLHTKASGVNYETE